MDQGQDFSLLSGHSLGLPVCFPILSGFLLLSFGFLLLVPIQKHPICLLQQIGDGDLWSFSLFLQFSPYIWGCLASRTLASIIFRSAWVKFLKAREGNAKECSNYRANALISHDSKVMLKILQGRLQQYMNRELPDAQAGFRKGRGTRDQIANIHWIIKKQKSSRKTSISALLTMPKPLTVWITINCGKF